MKPIKINTVNNLNLRKASAKSNSDLGDYFRQLLEQDIKAGKVKKKDIPELERFVKSFEQSLVNNDK